MRQTLVIMVKAPVLGRAKTRLARQIGAIEARHFYRSATASLLRRIGHDRRWKAVLAVDPPSASCATFWPTTIIRRPQGRGDLGQRMLEQFRLAVHGPVVLIGSDIPGISAHHIAAAFGELRRHDVVFGPSEDGGFWLIGLRAGHFPAGAFENVRWSSEHTLADSVRSFGVSHISYVETLFDVDNAADWRRWRALPISVGAR